MTVKPSHTLSIRRSNMGTTLRLKDSEHELWHPAAGDGQRNTDGSVDHLLSGDADVTTPQTVHGTPAEAGAASPGQETARRGHWLALTNTVTVVNMPRRNISSVTSGVTVAGLEVVARKYALHCTLGLCA